MGRGSDVDFSLALPQDVPLNGLTQGLTNGVNMGFQFQRQKMQQQAFQAEQEQAKALAAQKAEEMEEKKFRSSIDILTNKEFRKAMGKKTQLAYLKAAAPGLAKHYGIELPVDEIDIDDENDGPMEGLLQLIKSGAPTEMIKNQWQQDILGAEEPEEVSLLESQGKAMGFYDKPEKADKPAAPPAGYRWAADGVSLEVIPGGPAAASAAKETESQAISRLFGTRAGEPTVRQRSTL